MLGVRLRFWSGEVFLMSKSLVYIVPRKSNVQMYLSETRRGSALPRVVNVWLRVHEGNERGGPEVTSSIVEVGQTYDMAATR